jgi:3-dehydroquinate synthase
MDTRIVTIDLDARSYDIYIGGGLLYRIADLMPQDLEGREIFLVTDRHVQSYANAIRDSLIQAGISRAEILVLEPGESAKSFEQTEKLCLWLLERGVSRKSLLIAVGGGVVGDLAGFCASVVLRGIPFIQVPTTLLAQVDSSVGGKSGINTALGKNMVGSFYQPTAVIADIETLKTLPQRELLAGYAEIVKYGLINDVSFFAWLEANGSNVCALEDAAIAHAIEVSVKSKAGIVQNDEREETGQRALLNLGHTFGHALETAAGYDGRLLHGEAVAIGMCMAFDLSTRMGLCLRGEYERVEQHFAQIGLPTHAAYINPALNTSPDQLIEIMRRDKKTEAGKMRFIVASRIGETFISSDVPENLVRDVLKDSLGASVQNNREKWKSAFSASS